MNGEVVINVENWSRPKIGDWNQTIELRRVCPSSQALRRCDQRHDTVTGVLGSKSLRILTDQEDAHDKVYHVGDCVFFATFDSLLEVSAGFLQHTEVKK